MIKSLNYHSFVDKRNGIAYFKLVSFSKSAGNEFKDAIIELSNISEIKGIILDLRSNPGGLLLSAVDVLEKILSKGKLVVKVVGRDSLNVRKYYTKESPLLPDVRIVVLIDSNSASASEIVAGAIQDHDVGLIVGEPSYGKGLVQSIINLPYSASLKITVGRYFTPSGRCIQKVDYSRDNSFVKRVNLLKEKKFTTMHNRIVFSAGGISPDTIITRNTFSDIIASLKKDRIFFLFGNYYVYNNTNIDIKKLSPGILFKEFKKFLFQNEFVYHSELFNTFKQFKLIAIRNHSELKEEIDILEQKLNYIDNSVFNAAQNEIVNSIIAEIIRRVSGNKEKLKFIIENDKQVLAALEIINNESLYYSFLRGAK